MFNYYQVRHCVIQPLSVWMSQDMPSPLSCLSVFLFFSSSLSHLIMILFCLNNDFFPAVWGLFPPLHNILAFLSNFSLSNSGIWINYTNLWGVLGTLFTCFSSQSNWSERVYWKAVQIYRKRKTVSESHESIMVAGYIVMYAWLIFSHTFNQCVSVWGCLTKAFCVLPVTPSFAAHLT